MANILIIGNGFDLYHHYPTRYTDFLFFVNYWELFKSEHSKATFNVDPVAYIDISLSDKGELTEKSIKDFAKYINAYDEKDIVMLDNKKDNHWINYFNTLLSNNQIAGNKWIDFEAEIQTALGYIDLYFDTVISLEINKVISYSIPPRANDFISDFNKGESEDLVLPLGAKRSRVDIAELNEIKKHYINNILGNLNDLIICLNIYMLDFVSIIKCHRYSEQIKELCVSDSIQLLNFNYTDTFKCIYDKENLLSNHSVHGNAREWNVVLGIPDDSYDSTEYVYFQKYFQRIQKKTGSFYKTWIKDTFKPIPVIDSSEDDYPQVYILGHSLAETDKGVLKDFFQNDSIKKITIFYHSQKSYEDMVINLIELFGKEFVIENTGSERVCFVKLIEAKAIE